MRNLICSMLLLIPFACTSTSQKTPGDGAGGDGSGNAGTGGIAGTAFGAGGGDVRPMGGSAGVAGASVAGGGQDGAGAQGLGGEAGHGEAGYGGHGVDAGGGEGGCMEPDGCVECFTGTRCSDDGVEGCVEGQWTLQESCEAPNSICVGGACAACTPGDRRCIDTSNPEVCNDTGNWEPAASCEGTSPVCHEGECVLCAPDAKRCTGNVPETCASDGGSWVRGAACAGASPACLAATATCGRCAEGARQCNEGTPQVCSAQGEWVDQTTCSGALPRCSGGACVQCDPSEGNGRRCSGTTPQVCSAQGSWQSEAACSGTTPVCRPETGRCSCMENSTRCQSSTPQRCTNGAWVNQPACSGDTPVCLSNGTCGCTNGATRCSNSTTPQRCTNNTWVNDPTCTGDAPVCYQGACVCREGDLRCTASAGAGRQTCTNRAWASTTACSGNTAVCYGQGMCGCAPGATRCESPRVAATCSNDRAWTLSTCGDFQACSSGRCVSGPNAPGAIVCGRTRVCSGSQQCCYNQTTERMDCQTAVPAGEACLNISDNFQTEFDCDGPSDCPSGQRCCMTAQVIAACTTSVCTDSYNVRLCDPSAGIQNNPACAASQSCNPASYSTLSPSISFCEPPVSP